jgi:hypothetical protein
MVILQGFSWLIPKRPQVSFVQIARAWYDHASGKIALRRVVSYAGIIFSMSIQQDYFIIRTDDFAQLKAGGSELNNARFQTGACLESQHGWNGLRCDPL